MRTDGERLQALLAETNRAEFARKHGLKGGGSLISQHVSGHRPISLDAAVVYARALGVSLEAVSPAAASSVRAAAELLAGAATPATPAPPRLEDALPVVLDAIAACPDRDELRALLPLLATGVPAYRQRLAELLQASATPTATALLQRKAEFETKDVMAPQPAKNDT